MMSTSASNAYSGASGVLSVVIPIILILIIKICLGILVGNIAKKKGYSFAGFFILGLFFFIIGLIVALCIYDKSAQINTLTNVLKTAKTSNTEELLHLKELLDKNIITQEEFEQKKKRLLGL